MDKFKTPKHYIEKIILDIEFVIGNMNYVSLIEFEKNELLNNAVSFKFIQIAENAKQIPEYIVNEYPHVPWNKIKALRNRIVHDYGNVKLDVIYDTIIRDLPDLLTMLKNIII